MTDQTLKRNAAVLGTPKSWKTLTLFLRRMWHKQPMALAAMVLILIIVICAIAAPLLSEHDPVAQDLPSQLQGPSSEYLFGTDELGRDIFSRVLYGARISLLVGLISTATGVIIGTLLGLTAGYSPKLDTWIMRLMDILLAFPSILLAIAVIAVLGPNLLNVMIAVGVRSIPTYARVVRSTALQVKSMDFVTAARSIGGSDPRIILRHIAPNCVNAIIVMASLQFGEAILTASILSFLGLGVQPPTPEWGQMVNTGRNYLREAPHISTIPGMTLFLLVMAFNIAGDGLRELLDPRTRNR